MKRNILFLIGLFAVVFFWIVAKYLPQEYVVFHADFKLWSTFSQVIEKHLYLWSNANSAANLDGSMRIFTRVPIYFFSAIAGHNILISYFYIIFSLWFAVGSSYLFGRLFIGMQSKWIVFIFSLIFALNPIFLGNISKIGLMYSAVAVLPMLVLMKYFFDLRRPHYIFYTTCLFIFSIIHPYTLMVNLFIVSVYTLFRLKNNYDFVRQSFLKILFWVVLSFISFSYIYIPLISIGTVSKSEIASTIGKDSGVLNLVGIAKTVNFQEAFSLGKSVFLDYDFYSKKNKNYIYIINLRIA